MAMSGSILVVDDEAGIRDMLAMYLNHAGYRVECAQDVPTAEAMVRKSRPDLVLLDWGLPGTPGLTFARRLRGDQRTRDISIMMLTGRAEEQDRITGLDGGADDYLVKPYSLRELMARIRAVMRRRTPQLADEVIEVAGIRLDPGLRRVSIDAREVPLWSTEFKLLHFFMTHTGRAYTRVKLLDAVWGDNVFVEERTVDVHIRRLRQALSPTSHHKLLETVRGVGYRFVTEAEQAAQASTPPQQLAA
jgi:two-component system phosphate regulon response regulator PhoB